MDIAANLQLRVLNALPMHIVVIDRDGRLVTANRAWEDFAARNDAGGHPSVAPGANYLDVCRRAVAAGDRSALEALQGIEAVMDGHQPLFSMEYACHSPREQRWFSMTVAPLEPDGGGGAVVTHLDVTERRRAEEALRSSEERFRAIFECAAIGIAVADGQGQLTQCNQAGCDMLGYTLEELREAYRPSLLHPDDREANMAEIHRLMAGEINRFEIENRFLRKDGQPVWVHKIFSVLRDRAGQPECFISLITDTTARRNVEAALRESEERYRTIFEGVPIGIAVADPEGRIAQFNPAGCAMLGYTWEELRALHPSDLVYPEDREADSSLVHRHLAGEVDRLEIENRLVRKDGEPIWVHKVFSVLRDRAGKPASFISLITDTTARRNAEAALRESEERYRSLVEQAMDGIFLADPGGRYLDVNPAGVRMVGYTPEEIRRLTVNDLIVQEELPRMPGQFERLSSGAPVVSCWKFRRKDGSSFIGELVGRKLPDGRLLGQLRDVSERIRAEEALERLNATLEARVAERTAALAASEERQRAILDTVVDAVVTIDLLGTIVDVNPATERMFGHSKAEMLDRNVTMLMPSPYREEHDGYLHRFRRTGVRKALLKGREVMGQRRDGTTFPLELAVGQVAHLGLFTGVLHDLTGRKQIEADVLRIGERERESAAADLHDGVCQELLGLSFLATGMLPDLQALSPRLSTRLRRIANAIAQAAEHTRQVARGMNPLIRGGDGLMEALRQLAETVRHTHRVRCLFQCGEPVLLPESTAAFQIYRVAQEAIQNALRHGQATRVTIRLSEDARSVRLEILDNGRGFPRGVAPADGLGLRTMRYRLGLVGGELTVEQRKRGGVEVRCLVPRPPAAS